MKNAIFYAIILLIYSPDLFAQAPRPFGPLPTTAQLNWHEMEAYCIIHYGVDTYTDKEWGFGDESPELINPDQFNAKQIVSAAKAGGFRGVVVVAKHHDGLCLWPTKTTTHSIAASKWKNGQGDMIRDYQVACEALGMQLGLYCSPWDRNSAVYGQPAYIDLYQQQLRELNSNYGKVFISWHDGANGGTGYYGGTREDRKIEKSTYYKWPENWGIIRKLQPGAVIFGDVGPDVRWVGNEEGIAGETSWATYTPEAPEEGKLPSNGFSQYWKATEGTANGKFWMPAECDVPMRPGWFYHSSQNDKIKTASELLNLYYQSVGRGANLNLGISPNQHGLLDQRDVTELTKFGDLLKQTFQTNLLQDAKLQPSNIRGDNSKSFGMKFLVDSDRYSYWATDDNILTPQVVASFATAKSFDIIQLRENIKLGQRIRAFSIDVMRNGVWQEIATGTSIGANKLIRLTTKIKTSQIRLRITKADACVAISHFGIYNEPYRPKKPEVLRISNGTINIKGERGTKIYYTLNGDSPSEKSSRYTHVFDFKSGGLIKAIAIDNQGRISDVNIGDFGQSKLGWKVWAASTADLENKSSSIDDNPNSVWKFKSPDNGAYKPVEIQVDMGEVKQIKAFTFLPGNSESTGMIDQYQIEVSDDGKSWEKILSGEFANIKSNPIEQIIRTKSTLRKRYFKFIATHILGSEGFEVAELGIR